MSDSGYSVHMISVTRKAGGALTVADLADVVGEVKASGVVLARPIEPILVPLCFLSQVPILPTLLVAITMAQPMAQGLACSYWMARG